MRPLIELEQVSVRYRTLREGVRSLKEFAIRWVRGQIGYIEIWALKKVSLEVKPSEVVGLIGRNGAGKSTLLKVIARVIKPVEGTVQVTGKVAPLLELGSGFDLELTGIENISLHGSILGYNKRKMNEKIDRIVEFSELGDFVRALLRTYSSGMIARLGFSIATDTEPDVLILDEVLGVGDQLFRKKCEDRIRRFLEAGTTTLFVSHDLRQINSMCRTAVWLDHGQVISKGEVTKVTDEYLHFLDLHYPASPSSSVSSLGA